MKSRTCTMVQIRRATGHDGAVSTVRAQNSPCPIHVPTGDAHDGEALKFALSSRCHTSKMYMSTVRPKFMLIFHGCKLTNLEQDANSLLWWG